MNIKDLTKERLAGMIDHTQLKAYVTLDDLKKLCDEARQYHFKSVAINGAVTPFCYEQLKGSGVLCDVSSGFPLGQSTIESKVFEARDAIAKGAGEIDYVLNVVELKSGHRDYVAEEMRRMVEACHELNTTIKVIFENCYLTDDEKKICCEIALKERPDFIKTSTGFGTGGATVEDVRLMKAMVGDELKVKAAGGIRSYETAMAMIEAGAERLGTSAGIAIIEGYQS